MRFETSFFSLTLYKKLLTRYWPMWAMLLVIWLGAVPVRLLNSSDFPADVRSLIAAEFADYPVAASPLAAYAAILVAVSVFFYLFKDTAMNLMNSLPLRREGLFATSCVAGFTILLAPILAVFLLTLPVEVALDCLNVPALLRFLAGNALTVFFWFSFAALCCVISGNLVSSIAFFSIFNGVVYVMYRLVDSLLQNFLYGYVSLPTVVEEAVDWCTPLLNLFSRDPTWWEKAGIYAGVGFLMLLASLGLHHIRRAERTGDLVSFTVLRYAFKVCVIFCGGLALGLAFLALFFGALDAPRGAIFHAPLTACCCAAAAISAFVAEMLLKKTFRVWKSWRWAAVSVLAFVLLLAVPQYDLLGFESRIPDPGRVASATATFYGEFSDRFSRDFVYEGDAVEALTRLHTYAITDGRDYTLTGNYLGSSTVELSYTLKSGLTLHREYTFALDDSAEGKALAALITDTLSAGQASFSPPNLSPNTVYVSWTTDEKGTSIELGSKEARQLLAAVMEDVAAGRYNYTSDETQLPIEITFSFSWEAASDQRRYFYCSPNTTSANAAIAKLFPTPPLESAEPYPSTSSVDDLPLQLPEEEVEFSRTEIVP